MTPDLKGLHYLTAPNQVQLDRGNKAPLIENSGEMFSYDPYGYRCCQHNTAMGWPYYAQRLWMASGGDGLAAVFYAPNTVTARWAGGAPVTIEETTDYPFGETVTFVVKTTGSARFPLSLRVPNGALRRNWRSTENRCPRRAPSKAG
ncbi:MAG: glycoside hydrolase family 127 protein [Bryobacterales bacterium]|nr:glycoside hydrolase family 127 protein [Bryobacterales bacterium]